MEQKTLAQKIREECKSHFIFYYILSVLFLAWMVISFISALQLDTQYYFFQPVQIIVTVLCPLTAVLYVILFLAIYQVKLVKKIYIFVILLLLIFKTVILGLFIFSLIVSSDYYVCGFFVNTSGDLDGYSIAQDIDLNPSIPSCTQLEYENPNLSLQSMLILFCEAIIQNQCDNNLDCISDNSLVLKPWVSVFALSIVSVSIGALIEITFSLFLRSLIKKITASRALVQKNQLIPKQQSKK